MHGGVPAPVDGLADACAKRSVALLLRNLTPAGMLAATPGPDAAARGYLAVFGRDAAVCDRHGAIRG